VFEKGDQGGGPVYESTPEGPRVRNVNSALARRWVKPQHGELMASGLKIEDGVLFRAASDDGELCSSMSLRHCDTGWWDFEEEGAPGGRKKKTRSGFPKKMPPRVDAGKPRGRSDYFPGGIVYDLTARKRAGSALRACGREEERYRVLFDTLAGGDHPSDTAGSEMPGGAAEKSSQGSVTDLSALLFRHAARRLAPDARRWVLDEGVNRREERRRKRPAVRPAAGPPHPSRHRMGICAPPSARPRGVARRTAFLRVGTGLKRANQQVNERSTRGYRCIRTACRMI